MENNFEYILFDDEFSPDYILERKRKLTLIQRIVQFFVPKKRKRRARYYALRGDVVRWKNGQTLWMVRTTPRRDTWFLILRRLRPIQGRQRTRMVSAFYFRQFIRLVTRNRK